MKHRDFIVAGLGLAVASNARAETDRCACANSTTRICPSPIKPARWLSSAPPFPASWPAIEGRIDLLRAHHNRPMTVCPFCETEAGWPDDILAIYTKRMPELGMFKDEETGFVSRVRLRDAIYERS